MATFTLQEDLEFLKQREAVTENVETSEPVLEEPVVMPTSNIFTLEDDLKLIKEQKPPVDPKEITSQPAIEENINTMSMVDLEKDSRWLDNAKKIYEHEEGKPFTSEESGYNNLGDWFQNRHSKLGFNLTNIGMTALRIDDMPQEIQKAWVDSLDLYQKADGDMESFLRAIKNTAYDPFTIGTAAISLGAGGVARLIGGKAASAAARFSFKEQLKKQLTQKGLTEEVLKKGLKDEGTKQLVKEAVKNVKREGFESVTKTKISKKVSEEVLKKGLIDKSTKQLVKEARKEAAKTVGKAAAIPAAATGATYTGGFSASKQYIKEKEIDPVKTATDAAIGAVSGYGTGRFLPVIGEKIGRAIAGDKIVEKAVKDASEIVSTPNVKVNTEVVENVAKSTITERLAKINTAAGRLFSSTAGLPKEIFEASLKRARGQNALALEIKSTIRGIDKEIKKDNRIGAKITDDQINDFFDTGTVSVNLEGTKTLERLQSARGTIINNEESLNNILGLKGKQRIGYRRYGNGTYITRTFESDNNVQYLNRIEDALQGKISGEFLTKVNNARTLIKQEALKANKQLDNETIDGMILAMVQRLAKPAEKETVITINPLDVLGRVVGKEVAGNVAKQSLKRKKNIAKPILELLGEQGGAVSRLSTTLTKQKQLLNEVEFLADVDKFARQALKDSGSDRATVQLGGLVSFLPKQTVNIVQKKIPKGVKREDVAIVGASKDFEDLTSEVLGSSIGGKTTLLKDLYTSPQFYKFVNNGIDYWSNPKSTGGKFTGQTFGNLAALGQATQTIFDQPAYLINTWGAVQGLATNGYMFRPIKGVKAIKQAGQDIYKEYFDVSGLSKAGLKRLTKLKEQGVIDSDLSAEIIRKNINLYGKETSNAFSKGYRKSMDALSQAYGTPDTYAKLVAHNLEMKRLKKIYPDLDEDEIFSRASQRVRDTMPSYTVASPFARQLSKLPIGTYALFPAEMARTTKNIIKIGGKDFIEGIRTGNVEQVKTGLARLGGLTITAGGLAAYEESNNEAYGITSDNQRALDASAPLWGQGGGRIFLQGFEENKNGELITRYVSSAAYDAQDYLKVPIRQLIGRALAGEPLAEFEFDQLGESVTSSILGPYVNPKFLTDALLNIVSKDTYDPSRPGFNLENIKRGALELGSAFEPGTVEIIRKYLDQLSAEEVDQVARQANGYPLTPDDLQTWMSTGIRPQTVDVDKAIRSSLGADTRQLKASDSEFFNYLRQIKPQIVTEELANSIVDEYRSRMEDKLKVTRRIQDKFNIFNNIEYTDKRGNAKKFSDTNRVFRAVTDNGRLGKIDVNLATASKGRFIPINPSDRRVINLFTEKFSDKNPVGLLNRLQEVRKEFATDTVVE